MLKEPQTDARPTQETRYILVATFGQGAGIVFGVVHVRYIVVVAVAVVSCIVVVCATPGTALPRTALRSQRAANVIMETLQSVAIIASCSPLNSSQLDLLGSNCSGKRPF